MPALPLFKSLGVVPTREAKSSRPSIVTRDQWSNQQPARESKKHERIRNQRRSRNYKTKETHIGKLRVRICQRISNHDSETRATRKLQIRNQRDSETSAGHKQEAGANQKPEPARTRSQKLLVVRISKQQPAHIRNQKLVRIRSRVQLHLHCASLLRTMMRPLLSAPARASVLIHSQVHHFAPIRA